MRPHWIDQRRSAVPTAAEVSALAAAVDAADNRETAERAFAAALRSHIAHSGEPLWKWAARLLVLWEHLADVISHEVAPSAAFRDTARRVFAALS